MHKHSKSPLLILALLCSVRMVCNGVETEPVLQDITGEELNRGANTNPGCVAGYNG